MNIQRFIWIVLLSCFFLQKGWSQDSEFSQFYAAPTHLNPAMIGFSTEARLALNYRHHLPSFGNTYLTMAASYDQHFADYNSSIGVSILANREGGGIYNTYLVSGLYAYQLQLNRSVKVKFGTQISYLQQSIAWDKLVFGDMIDPISGAVAGTTLELNGDPAQTSIHRFDLGLGALAYTDQLYLGASFKHIVRPNLDFSGFDDSQNKLHVRSVFHLGYVFYMGKEILYKTRFYVSPNAMFINQHKFNQLTFGSYAGKGKIFGGAWLRHNLDNFDAFILLVGLKVGIYKFGYSYDVNLKNIGTSTSAHEISMMLDFGQTKWSNKKAKRKKSAECPEIF